MDKMTRLHLFVSGRVQGVFFRQSTKEKARKLNLNGWVKNLEDGRVEIVSEGEEGKNKKLLDWVRKGGPLLGRVDNIEIKKEDFRKEFASFDILY